MSILDKIKQFTGDVGTILMIVLVVFLIAVGINLVLPWWFSILVIVVIVTLIRLKYGSFKEAYNAFKNFLRKLVEIK